MEAKTKDLWVFIETNEDGSPKKKLRQKTFGYLLKLTRMVPRRKSVWSS